MDCVVQLLFVFCCLPSETSDSLLVFALYIGNPLLTNGNVLIADDVIGSISVSLSRVYCMFRLERQTMSITQFHNWIHPVLVVAGNRDFKNIATAGADTAAPRILSPKWDTAHVLRLPRSSVKSDCTSGVVLRSGCYVKFFLLPWPFTWDILAF